MSKLSNIVSNLVNFHARHSAAALMVWVLSCLAAAVAVFPRSGEDVLMALMIGAMIALLTIDALRRYEDALEARITTDDADAGHVWQVQLNGVNVGQIKDAHYALIRREVFFDGGVYLRQLLNLGYIMLRALDYLFVALPLCAFWLALGSFIFAPVTFADILSALQTVTREQAIAAIPTLAQTLTAMAVLFVGLHLMIGRTFGFKNHFDLECKEQVRHNVGCAADGELLLYRLDGNTIVWPNEIQTIHRL